MNRIYFERIGENKGGVISADRIVFTENGDFVKVYNGENLVGLFDVGNLVCIYLTEKTERK